MPPATNTRLAVDAWRVQRCASKDGGDHPMQLEPPGDLIEKEGKVRRRVFRVERCPECGTPCAQVTYSELVAGSDMVSTAQALMRVGCVNRMCRYFDAGVNACKEHEALTADGRESAC